MSDPKLPTLWVNPIESTGNARSGTWTRDPGDTTTRPYVARAEHVSASALDAANEALRVANEENKRLRETMRRVAASMDHSGGENPEYLPCNESCTDCDDETIGEKHRSDLPEDRCSDHPDADGELDCWRCLLTAALAPKESSDG